MNSDVLNILKTAICETNIFIEESDIPLDKGLMNSGVIDSAGFIEIVLFIENRFDIEITEEEINGENFKNLISIVTFIERKTND